MRDLTRRRRMLTVFVTAIALATAVGVAALYPYGGPPTAAQQGFGVTSEERFGGEITAVFPVEGADDVGFLLPGAVSVLVEVRLDDGRRLQIDTVDEAGSFTVGKAVRVAQINAPGAEPVYAIVDFPRGLPLTALMLVFGMAVIALGRWQGLRALIGLGVSGVLIVAFLIPALLAGRDAVALALVVSLAVMFTTLPLSHGWSMTTRAAAAGTAVALIVTIGLTLLAVQATSLTGLTSEDVQLVRFATGVELDVRGLLLAGIIIGTLGVLDDVTVSQASTVAALRRSNPSASDRHVFNEALRVGRDHIAATVNTLFLAYAGAALPLLILFSIGDAPVSETLTSELVAQEVVRAIVGSLGLILAVPLTTAIAALTVDGTAPVLHDHPSPDDPVLPPDPVTVAVAATSPAPGDSSPEDARAWEGSLRRSYGLDDDGPADPGPV